MVYPLKRKIKMIYIIRTKIGEKLKEQKEQFTDKFQAVTYYRLKVRELCFPESIDVELLYDGD